MRATHHDLDPAAAIGLVFAFFSAASVLGSLLAASFADRLPRLPTYFLAFVICGAPRFVVFAIHSPIVVIVAVTVGRRIRVGVHQPDSRRGYL